ncbi:MAG: tetratricopeptide repeat protein [candidate division WOR-3 bacterium]|nr:MAG: tetratricopeptide repeat protein [candidate division WOR-3 bacterium]
MQNKLNSMCFLAIIVVSLFVWCAPTQTVQEPTAKKTTEEQRIEAEKHYSIGFEYYKQGNYDEAIKNFNMAIEGWPQFYAAYIALAKAFRAKNDIAATQHQYEKAKALDPKDPRSYEGLGALYTELTRFGDAIGEYESGLRIDATNVNLLNGLGYVYTKMGSYDTALEYYNRSLEYEPENLTTMFAIADIFIETNEPRKATAYLEAIIEKKPNIVEVREKLAQTYFELKNYESAAKIYSDLVKEQPDNYRYHIQLGAVYVEQKKFQAAEEALNTARRLAPTSAAPIYQLVDLNIKRGRYTAAEELAREALNIEPNNLYAYLLLGDIYIRRGYDARGKWMNNKSTKNCSFLDAAISYFNTAISQYTKAKSDAQLSSYANNEIKRSNTWLEELREDKWFYCKGGSQ